MTTTTPGASAPKTCACSCPIPCGRCTCPPQSAPTEPEGPRRDADGDVIPELVAMPPGGLSEFELHTKNALAVAMLSTSDRRALGAIGYFAIETAALRPLLAWAVAKGRKALENNPEKILEVLDAFKGLAQSSAPSEGDEADLVAVCTSCADERRRTQQSNCQREVAKAHDSFATPDAYTAWLTLPATVAPGDLSVVVQSTVTGIVAVTLTRPPREGEEFLARGITLEFPLDARTTDLSAVLEGNLLTVRVPRRSNLAIPVTGPRSPEATAETIPAPAAE